MQIIAFMHGSTLFIQTEWPVHHGRMRLLDQAGMACAECQIHDVDFLSVPVNCPSGRYLIQIRAEDEITEKYVYI